MFKKLSVIFFISFLFLFGQQNIYAQVNNEDIQVKIVPEFPKENEDVSISIESYAFDLDSSVIDFKVNDKSISKSIGQKKFIVKSGKNGVETLISIDIKTQDGQSINKTFSIKPSSIDIIWEADTYIPPFFKGKPLFTRQSLISIYAIPHIFSGKEELAKERMIYNWTMNGKALNDLSGYGRYYIKINSGVLGRDMNIEVEVNDLATGESGYGNILIPTREPVVYIYEKDPLLGVKYEKTIEKSEIKKSNEKEFYIVPYFFSTKNIKNLTYEWFINGDIINDNINTESRIFRKIEGVFGKAQVDVYVKHNSKIMQSANSSMIIDFEKPKTEINNNVL